MISKANFDLWNLTLQQDLEGKKLTYSNKVVICVKITNENKLFVMFEQPEITWKIKEEYEDKINYLLEDNKEYKKVIRKHNSNAIKIGETFKMGATRKSCEQLIAENNAMWEKRLADNNAMWEKRLAENNAMWEKRLNELKKNN